MIEAVRENVGRIASSSLFRSETSIERGHRVWQRPLSKRRCYRNRFAVSHRSRIHPVYGIIVAPTGNAAIIELTEDGVWRRNVKEHRLQGIVTTQTRSGLRAELKKPWCERVDGKGFGGTPGTGINES